jgi:hypothetical protein
MLVMRAPVTGGGSLPRPVRRAVRGSDRLSRTYVEAGPPENRFGGTSGYRRPGALAVAIA